MVGSCFSRWTYILEECTPQIGQIPLFRDSFFFGFLLPPICAVGGLTDCGRLAFRLIGTIKFSDNFFNFFDVFFNLLDSIALSFIVWFSRVGLSLFLSRFSSFGAFCSTLLMLFCRLTVSESPLCSSIVTVFCSMISSESHWYYIKVS